MASASISAISLCFGLWLIVSTDCVTLNSLERNSAGKKLKSGDVIVYRNAESTDNSLMTKQNATIAPQQPLTCHQCHSFADGDSCTHLAADNSNFSKRCNSSQTSCMVTINPLRTSLIMECPGKLADFDSWKYPSFELEFHFINFHEYCNYCRCYTIKVKLHEIARYNLRRS